MEETPLPTLFEQAREIHFVADSGADQAVLKRGCQLLQQCDEMVGKLGLFSSNETKEDISTVNLKYLLIPFYLGELTEKVASDDRIQTIKISEDRLKEFISTCEAMELVPEEELDTNLQQGSVTFAAQRARKIARFRRQKFAEAKLQEIKERKERQRRSTRAGAFSSPIENGEDDTLDDDSEEEREAWLITISLALCKAFDLLDMLKKEEEMLTAVKEKQLQEGEGVFSQTVLDERTEKAEAWHQSAVARSQYTKPAQPITCATFAQDVIEGRARVSEAQDHKHQPIMFGPASLVNRGLTSERERMAAQVFQPGHRLPTMSIEEAGLREMEMMNNWQERTAKYIEEANSSWHNNGQKQADNGDDDDEAVEKARAWDDWKDDHPRGAGNKKLTPCG
ncbi:PP2A regulatory subunit TAP46-like [Aristolochia californica]|uniref:PP2A regulatory subunit TAP46-like n=1 Tax=Aristolochia californica TaxID=171875 RepID=UPI0035DEB9E6